MRILAKAVIGAVITAVVGYGAMAAWFFVRQRDTQYDRSGRMLELAETALTNAQVVAIPTADGETLGGWFASPAPGLPVILYFRGNTGSFAREHERFEGFAADGYGFLAFDYRGFPGSPGELTEEHVLEDALAAFDWLAQKDLPIVIWGRSLGSGPATFTASRREAGALLLEAPFTSAAAYGKRHYGYLPIDLILLDRYPVVEWIKAVEEPVFVAHGTADIVNTPEEGVRVYALAPNPAGIWIEPGGDHDNMWERGIWERAKAFYAEAMR